MFFVRPATLCRKERIGSFLAYRQALHTWRLPTQPGSHPRCLAGSSICGHRVIVPKLSCLGVFRPTELGFEDVRLKDESDCVPGAPKHGLSGGEGAQRLD